MNTKFLTIAFFLLLLTSVATAKYELCDSTDYDLNAGKLTCNISSTRFAFSQQDIDNFWEKLQEDGAFQSGAITEVLWKIKNATVQISDDLYFVQPEETNLAWDLVMQADGNNVFAVDSNATPLRQQTHAAIKKSMNANVDYLISFAPIGDRRSLRNITLEKLSGGKDVYISGGTVKKIEIDIEGTLTLDNSFIKNLGTVKAQNIVLNNKAYLENAEKIQGGSLSIEGNSFINGLGKFGETAISLEGNLSLTGNSYISDFTGNLETKSDITISGGSRIEMLEWTQSKNIETIKAKNLTLTEGSLIKGIGSKRGKIILSEGLSLDGESEIIGFEQNRPAEISAKSIIIKGNSSVKNFSGEINVTGNNIFRLDTGGSIKLFSGTINSCAPIIIDGNTSTISFVRKGEMNILAKELVLNNNAEITCYGEGEGCNYSLTQRQCGGVPIATLDLNSASTGFVPLEVVFSGQCDGRGEPVTCTLMFGDENTPQIFSGEATHLYEGTGTFTAVLTATNSEGVTSTAEKTIIVRNEGEPLPTEALEATASTATVEQGSQISVDINCQIELQAFSLENDLGLPAITEIPECPATLGPFTVPEDASTGSHMFTISATASDGSLISKNVPFTVQAIGQGGILPDIGAIFNDLIAGNILTIGGALLLLILIGVAVLGIFVINKKMAEKKAWLDHHPEEAGKAKAGKQAAAKETQPAKETPPWITSNDQAAPTKPKKEKPTAPKPGEKKTVPAAKPEPKKPGPMPSKAKEPGSKAPKPKTGLAQLMPKLGFLQPKPKPAQQAQKPVQPTPGLVQPTPEPAKPTQKPMQPTPGLVQPTPGLVQPTPGLVQPTPGLVQPTPGPAKPAAKPAVPGQTMAEPKQKSFADFIQEVEKGDRGQKTGTAPKLAAAAPGAAAATGAAKPEPAAAMDAAKPAEAKPVEKDQPSKFRELVEMLKKSKENKEKEAPAPPQTMEKKDLPGYITEVKIDSQAKIAEAKPVEPAQTAKPEQPVPQQTAKPEPTEPAQPAGQPGTQEKDESKPGEQGKAEIPLPEKKKKKEASLPPWLQKEDE